MVELGVENELMLWRPGMIQEHNTHQGFPDVEMTDCKEITPRPRDFQQNTEDLEVEPYETPTILTRRARPVRVIKDSDAETHISETLQSDTGNRREAKAHSTSEGATRVCRWVKLRYVLDW